ncbi:MAG: ROK family protein [Planctomycetaceae bacterium]|jgi:glucokinase|nr:ROK family protein [Planctomycetaceae bacterium]
MDIMVEEKILFPVIEAARPLFVGMNFGGAYLKIGIIDNEGRTVSFFAVPHQGDQGPDSAMKQTAQALKLALEKTGTKLSAIAAAGYSFPGSLDPKTEQMHRPPNFPDWEGYPIVAKLAEYTGLKSVTFSNNANAAAYAEYWVGASKGSQSSCLLLLDTGIGCGIIVEGREITGAHGFGGEFGHMIVDPSPGARWCGCLQQGCLEAYCSSLAVARRAQELVDVGHPTSLKDRMASQDEFFNIARMVYEEANNGDEWATHIVLDTARFLGLGIVTLLHTIDPECVLIGGEMMFGGKGSKVGDMFLAKIREVIEHRAIRGLGQTLKLDFAALGPFASMIGAAGLAREDAMLFSIVEN